MGSKSGKLSSGHNTGKGQFSFQSQRTMTKNVQTTVQLGSFHIASKVMLKIFQARLQQYVNWELPDVQAGFQRGKGTRDQIGMTDGSWRKQRSSRKTSTSSLTTWKPLTVWITTNCGKFLKRWEYQITLPVSWETCMQVKKQQNWTWNNRLVPNWERSITRLHIVTLLV